MAMDAKDEIKQRINIAELISEYLELKPAGSGSFKALCPFHGEKSPSFHISVPKEIWHCFGCAKGGDVFSFVMEMEGMSFPEAMRFLGKKVGVEVPEFTPKRTDNGEETMKALHEQAGSFYEALLWNHPSGETAKAYLVTRNINETLSRLFQLGASPDSWDTLVAALKKRGATESMLVKAGLASTSSKGNAIDRFRNRLMIPLHDAHGAIVGFTARQLMVDDRGPKYLNSPETPIYHKGNILYGLHLAKTGIRTQKCVVIVEGNLDVIASHKAGVEHVVASSGTALTENQLRILKKLTDRLLFCFDSDAAGFTAAQRGIRLAQEMGFNVEVVSIPTDIGKDPDEVVQKDPEAWKRLVKEPVAIVACYFARALDTYDIKTVDGKKKLTHFLVEEISRIKDVVEREHWLQRLSDVVRVDIGVLRSLVAQQRPSTTAPALPKPMVAVQKAPVFTKMDQSCSFLIGLVLLEHETAHDILARLNPYLLPEEPWRRVYKSTVLLYTELERQDSTQFSLFARLSASLEGNDPLNDIPRLRSAMLRVQNEIEGQTRDQVREELNLHINILAAVQKDAKRKTLEAAIREAEQAGDTDRMQSLLSEFTKLL